MLRTYDEPRRVLLQCENQCRAAVQRQAKMRRQVAKAERILGPASPQIIELRASLLVCDQRLLAAFEANRRLRELMAARGY